ncbi:Hin recombinase [Salmonella enterica]|nr:Hin recombinase [Salmonella enterica]EEJ9029293.1 Hin recombinase [Salmonella enterica subsp. enterica]
MTTKYGGKDSDRGFCSPKLQEIISAVAEFEKDLLIGFGRPSALNQEQRQTALEHLKAGSSISAVAREFGTSRQTIMRLRDDAVGSLLPE